MSTSLGIPSRHDHYFICILALLDILILFHTGRQVEVSLQRETVATAAAPSAGGRRPPIGKGGGSARNENV